MKDLPTNTTCATEVDATVFESAQNEANPIDVPVGAVLSATAPSKLLRSQPVRRARGKNTGDLQWKIGAVCNARD